MRLEWGCNVKLASSWENGYTQDRCTFATSWGRWPLAHRLEAHRGLAWAGLIFSSASAGWVHAWVSQKCFHPQLSVSTRLVGHTGTDRSSPKPRLVVVSPLEREARRWPNLQEGGEGSSPFPVQPSLEGSSRQERGKVVSPWLIWN